MKTCPIPPATRDEMHALGWDQLDIILVTGDAYIDSPLMGVAVIARGLLRCGYRVGVIPQPDTESGEDIARLGTPRLFWGVTGGCVDSLVANRTATGKRRRQDDFTPGGRNDHRPDRATIVYSNLIRRCHKEAKPIVLGGIEASLRRIAHYDFWSDRVRRSVLLDAKADYLLYGMADRSVRELARCLANGEDPREVRGLCYVARERPTDALELPSFEEVAANKTSFTEMFHIFYSNNDPRNANRLAQKQDTRYLVQNPPADYLNEDELDEVFGMEFTRDTHPVHAGQGEIRALQTIRFSITTHRGCFGECNFCAIAVHQGRAIRCRSEESILSEARRMAGDPRFKGTIHDVGGPTANMYGIGCERMSRDGCCRNRRCIHPRLCGSLSIDHGRQVRLLESLRKVQGVKRVIVASGIRYDLVLADEKHGDTYLANLVKHHVSGQLKIAPEHTETRVLELMGKPGREQLLEFRRKFFTLTRRANKDQYLTYYFIAAHPGCTENDMQALRRFAREELKLLPEQVQVFTPTPSTYSTLLYYTEANPFTGQPCFVEKSERGRARQKTVLLPSQHKAGKPRRPRRKKGQ